MISNAPFLQKVINTCQAGKYGSCTPENFCHIEVCTFLAHLITIVALKDRGRSGKCTKIGKRTISCIWVLHKEFDILI